MSTAAKKIENVKVNLKREHMHNGVAQAAGTTAELPEDIADALVAGGSAEKVAAPKPKAS